ncbi:MAG: hypothetical protein AAF828_11480, partial [Bacteroidota bacterium]
NDILYINNHVDLLSFTLTNPNAPVMVGRTEDVFEPFGIFTNDLGYEEMIVDYVPTDEVQFIDCTDPRINRNIFWDDGLIFAAEFDAATSNQSNRNQGSGNEQVGIGGSLARFTITNGTLYAVDESRLKTFNLNNPTLPEFMGNVNLGWGVETIFPHGNEIYIGTNTGMHIYDASEPLSPRRLGSIEHVRSCDPVVVNGDRAYVTLRGGTFCGGFSNQLEVIDVSNPSNPERMQIYPMDGPAGLSVADNKLFIAQPGHDFKIYQLEGNGLRGEELNSLPELKNAIDVIGLPWLDRIITLGSDGVQQFDYSNDGQLERLSLLDVCESF